MSEEIGYEVADLPRKRERLSHHGYVYVRELILPLLEAAGMGQPVLKMTHNDYLIAANHIVDGEWASSVEESRLPQFQQEARHLAFCSEFFGGGDDFE
jgi:hypothetical protein